MRELFAGLFAVFTLLFWSCNGAPAELKLIQQQRSGDYLISLRNDTGVIKNADHLTLEFRNASSNELVEVSNVQVQASMVMAGMGPMFGTLSQPRREAAGRYDFDVNLGMVGRWNFIVTFAPNQRVQFNINAQ
jgi:hypothetical protein